ncbi:AAA family ATPase [soil metagenome]
MILAFEEFEVDTDTFEVRRSGAPVRVQRKVLDLLLYLVRQRGRVATKDELFDQVWPGVTVSAAALPQAVKAVRRALGGDGDEERFIQNVRGRGYRFVPAVREQPSRDEATASSATPADRRDSEMSSTLGGGRVAPLGILQRRYRLAEEGEGNSVLLSGEAGIGKSHLADRFAAWAQHAGANVLRGRCTSAKGAPPLRPWLQILRASHSLAVEASVAPSIVQSITALLPEWTVEATSSPPSPLAPDGVFRAFDAVAELLQQVSATRPTLLMIDDLTWADAASLDLLVFLARELRGSRVMIVALHGNALGGLGAAAAQAMAAVRRIEKTYCMALGPMDAAEIAQLVRETAGREPSASEVAELAGKSGGNPLFVSQILQARDALAGRAGDDSSLFVREGVGDIIRHHLVSLSESCLATLAVASVFGNEFGLGPLSILLEAPSAAVLDCLHEALVANVVCKTNAEARRFRFAHTIVRDTVYHSMPPAKRARLHGAAAEALVRLGGADGDAAHLADIARHYTRAAPAGFVDKAVDACKRVAEDCLGRRAYDDAARQYRSALDLVEMGSEVVDRAALLSDLGRAAFRSGEWRSGYEALRESAAIAAKGGETRAYGAAVVGLTVEVEVAGASAEATRALDEARSRLHGSRAPEEAICLARSAIAASALDPVKARILAAESLAIARTLDHPGCLASALRAQFILLTSDPSLDAATVIEEALSAAGAAKDPETTAIAFCSKLEDAIRRGDTAMRESVTGWLTELATASKSSYVEWLAATARAAMLIHQGELGDALDASRDARALGVRAGFRGADSFSSGQTFMTLRATGQATPALELAREMVMAEPESAFWRVAFACVAAESGQARTARPGVERACAELRTQRHHPDYSAMLILLAQAAVAIEDETLAKLLFPMLTPFRRRKAVIRGGLVSVGCMSREASNLARLIGNGSDVRTLLQEAGEAEMRPLPTRWNSRSILTIRPSVDPKASSKRAVVG